MFVSFFEELVSHRIALGQAASRLGGVVDGVSGDEGALSGLLPVAVLHAVAYLVDRIVQDPENLGGLQLGLTDSPRA